MQFCSPETGSRLFGKCLLVTLSLIVLSFNFHASKLPCTKHTDSCCTSFDPQNLQLQTLAMLKCEMDSTQIKHNVAACIKR